MRGVSEIVGVIIVILFIILLAALISPWIQLQVTEPRSETECITHASYIIEDVNFISDEELALLITNYGDLGMYGFGVRLITLTGGFIPNASLSFSEGGIDQGDISECGYRRGQGLMRE